MNNFDENKDFVKRPTAGKADNTPHRPIRNIPTQVRRPASNQTAQRLSQNQVHKAPSNRKPTPTVSSVGVRAPAPQSPARKSPSLSGKREMLQESEKNGFSVGTVVKNIIIFIVMLAALLAIGLALILSSVAPKLTEKDSADYTYLLDDSEYSSITVNGVLYMNMSRLAEEYSFVVSGTKDSLRFTADDNEYVEFTIGSRSAKINGDMADISYGPALIRENENVWIPLTFAENYFSGIAFLKDEEEQTISITREELDGSTEDEPLYAKITFKVKGSQALTGIDEDPDIGDIADLGFTNDLSEYEQYMNPRDRDAYLILVNKTNSISADIIPENLVSIVNVRNDGRKEQMVECAEKALEAMFIEMKSAGYTDVSVTSGYRSYKKQESLFNTYLQREKSNDPSLSTEEAKAIVLTYSAYPGTSEHQTGLCCDMHNLPSADVSFANKEAYKWLKENCHKFGFVIRFPEDKVDITGYSFEPWHYRFVGRYHATRMKNLGMCLEEYVAHLKIAENN
ncbi:MAG: M15 family metallopeptidase [Clostridia bacterium]|nr:M15 family metallopeptidase [Clostridia bacterium]